MIIKRNNITDIYFSPRKFMREYDDKAGISKKVWYIRTRKFLGRFRKNAPHVMYSDGVCLWHKRIDGPETITSNGFKTWPLSSTEEEYWNR